MYLIFERPWGFCTYDTSFFDSHFDRTLEIFGNVWCSLQLDAVGFTFIKSGISTKK
jgi:hypothetical protein